jgi:hypothetical protein
MCGCDTVVWWGVHPAMSPQVYIQRCHLRCTSSDATSGVHPAMSPQVYIQRCHLRCTFSDVTSGVLQIEGPTSANFKCNAICAWEVRRIGDRICLQRNVVSTSLFSCNGRIIIDSWQLLIFVPWTWRESQARYCMKLLVLWVVTSFGFESIY